MHQQSHERRNHQFDFQRLFFSSNSIVYINDTIILCEIRIILTHGRIFLLVGGINFRGFLQQSHERRNHRIDFQRLFYSSNLNVKIIGTIIGTWILLVLPKGKSHIVMFSNILFILKCFFNVIKNHNRMPHFSCSKIYVLC